MSKNPLPTTLLEAVVYFADTERAFAFMRQLRWPNGKPVCPTCGCLDNSFVSTRRIWKCKVCARQFSLKVGTIFEDSPIGFDKWLPCIWLLANSKNSVSSCEVARALGVTQKTAWFMLHRIRLAMKSETFVRLSGTVEVDETYIGGSVANMHQKARVAKAKQPGGLRGKAAVQGARERDGGRVEAAVLHRASQYEMVTNVRFWVQQGSAVYSDETPMYASLETYGFAHKTVNHSRGTYVSGDVTTNGIENFWSLLKRALKGTQTHVAPGHLNRYVTERQFAYNLRDCSDLDRMTTAAAGVVGRRITYKQLTVKDSTLGGLFA